MGQCLCGLETLVFFWLNWFIGSMDLAKLPKPLLILGGLLLLSSVASLGAIAKLATLEHSLTPNSSPSSQIQLSQSATLAQNLVIDLQGAVSKPGVYEIKTGSRLIDALKLAGGLAEAADRYSVAKTFNLAKLLSDGEKIYIPALGELNGSTDNTNTLISINSASLTQLELLPGVGPVTAAKIVERRPYSSVEDLVSRRAIGEATLAKIINLISLDNAGVVERAL